MGDGEGPTGKAKALERVQAFVRRYVTKGPYGLYPEPTQVALTIDGLAENLAFHGKMYCPCVPIETAKAAGHELVCPCTPHHEDIARQGHCDCALFAKRDHAIMSETSDTSEEAREETSERA